MKTEQIFKQIYQDLKEEMNKNTNDIFLKEYTIPSKNYSPDSEYFTSGIEMKLEQMMSKFEHKIYFSSYKEKYFFSNNAEETQKMMLQEIKNEYKEDKKTSKIKELTGKLYAKVEDELKEFENEIKEKIPDEIVKKIHALSIMEKIIGELKEMKIDTLYTELEDESEKFKDKIREETPYELKKNLYKLITLKEINRNLKERKFDKNELKALLKEDNLLSEFYEDWKKSDRELRKSLQDTMEDTIDIIVEHYEKSKKEKSKNVR